MKGKRCNVAHTAHVRMKISRVSGFVLCVCATFSLGLPGKAIAAAVTLNASDAGGVSSFNGSGNWSDGNAPSAANDYTASSNYNLRTPTTNANYTFAGNSLTLGNGTTGATLLYKGTASGNTITVANLSLNKGLVSNGSGGAASFTLAGNVNLLSGGGTFDMGAAAGSILVNSTITRSGLLSIQDSANTASPTGYVSLTAANSYTGGTKIISNGSLHVDADGALGTGNVTLTSGMITFELGATNNYIADTAKLILSTGLVTNAVNLNFTGSDTIAGLSLDGGTTYLANGTYTASALDTLYGTNAFTGAGTLTVAAVPEPGTWALMLTGGACLLFLRARSRSIASV